MSLLSQSARWRSSLFGLLLLLGYMSGMDPKDLNILQSQEGAQTLRVDVDLVPVEVVVMDKKGKPLTGLKKSDFRIFLDGKEQPISTFDAVDENAKLRSLPSSLSDLDETSARGKVLLLLFDDSTISPAQSNLVREAAEQYVRQHMRPHDLVGIAVFRQTLQIIQPFTHDAAKVVEAIRKPSAAFTANSSISLTGPGGTKEARAEAQNVFRQFKMLCGSLEPIQGRKGVVLFTQDFSMYPDIQSDFDSLVVSAQKSNVSFFTLDALGSKPSTENQSPARGDNLRTTGQARTEPGGAMPDHMSLVSNVLRSLADQTNGFAVYNTDNLMTPLSQVDNELCTYYVLGCQPTIPHTDGRSHKIEIKLNAGGVRLKYRNTYLEPHVTDALAGSKNENLLSATLSSTAPAEQVPVAIRGLYFFESPLIARISIFAKIQRGSIELKKKDGQFMGSLNVMGAAYREDGSQAARFSGAMNISLDASRAEAFRNQDITYSNFLRLRPGQYQLKLAVLNEKGKVGKVEQGLLVPPWLPDQWISSSVLVSQETRALPGLIQNMEANLFNRKDPLIFKGYQIYAPVDAPIDSQREALVFFRLYLPGNSIPLQNFSLTLRLLNEKGDPQTFPTLNLKEVGQSANLTEIAVGFHQSFAGLPPGRYQLQVETSETLTHRSLVSQTEILLK